MGEKQLLRKETNCTFTAEKVYFHWYVTMPSCWSEAEIEWFDCCDQLMRNKRFYRRSNDYNSKKVKTCSWHMYTSNSTLAISTTWEGVWRVLVSIERNFTFAPIEFYSHWYVTMPSCWSEADVACPYCCGQLMRNNRIRIGVSSKLLKERNTKR